MQSGNNIFLSQFCPQFVPQEVQVNGPSLLSLRVITWSQEEDWLSDIEEDLAHSLSPGLISFCCCCLNRFRNMKKPSQEIFWPLKYQEWGNKLSQECLANKMPEVRENAYPSHQSRLYWSKQKNHKRHFLHGNSPTAWIPQKYMKAPPIQSHFSCIIHTPVQLNPQLVYQKPVLLNSPGSATYWNRLAIWPLSGRWLWFPFIPS